MARIRIGNRWVETEEAPPAEPEVKPKAKAKKVKKDGEKQSSKSD